MLEMTTRLKVIKASAHDNSQLESRDAHAHHDVDLLIQSSMEDEFKVGRTVDQTADISHNFAQTDNVTTDRSGPDISINLNAYSSLISQQLDTSEVIEDRPLTEPELHQAQCIANVRSCCLVDSRFLLLPCFSYSLNEKKCQNETWFCLENPLIATFKAVLGLIFMFILFVLFYGQFAPLDTNIINDYLIELGLICVIYLIYCRIKFYRKSRTLYAATKIGNINDNRNNMGLIPQVARQSSAINITHIVDTINLSPSGNNKTHTDKSHHESVNMDVQDDEIIHHQLMDNIEMELELDSEIVNLLENADEIYQVADKSVQVVNKNPNTCCQWTLLIILFVWFITLLCLRETEYKLPCKCVAQDGFESLDVYPYYQVNQMACSKFTLNSVTPDSPLLTDMNHTLLNSNTGNNINFNNSEVDQICIASIDTSNLGEHGRIGVRAYSQSCVTTLTISVDCDGYMLWGGPVTLTGKMKIVVTPDCETTYETDSGDKDDEANSTIILLSSLLAWCMLTYVIIELIWIRWEFRRFVVYFHKADAHGMQIKYHYLQQHHQVSKNEVKQAAQKMNGYYDNNLDELIRGIGKKMFEFPHNICFTNNCWKCEACWLRWFCLPTNRPLYHLKNDNVDLNNP